MSMQPGGGSCQSAKVRTRTRRRISGTTRRCFLPRVAWRATRKSRSIVAALMANTLARIASSSFKWPCRSSDGTKSFPGAQLQIVTQDGRFSVSMHQHGLLRPLSAAELSDGTLRYLLWTAAMLTPRPPCLTVLNEPESSLHPDLLPALARLIGVAAKSTQIFVVSHASRLIAALRENSACLSIELEKQFSETQILGQGRLDVPSWRWLTR
jgi:predicted ATPase